MEIVTTTFGPAIPCIPLAPFIPMSPGIPRGPTGPYKEQPLLQTQMVNIR